eukprot:CAMPEP_0182903666 /NCGR_PEP_ID=MMETSP0034_2-20130328/31482_1 /TAXON_ID=156128 /ORGANISM="Nephroselmis pyriformis, Strain CCMP717" /LENGTH=68 /DNA_ID=CAMNT_0025038611 /DNA_START=183 /DNA_END=385 /DNA_ORIENTATION=-
MADGAARRAAQVWTTKERASRVSISMAPQRAKVPAKRSRHVRPTAGATQVPAESPMAPQRAEVPAKRS